MEVKMRQKSTNLALYLLIISQILFSLGLSACQLKPIQRADRARFAPREVSIPDLSPVSLNNLTDLNQLQEAFNADRGSPRLILLLSPT